MNRLEFFLILFRAILSLKLVAEEMVSDLQSHRNFKKWITTGDEIQESKFVIN